MDQSLCQRHHPRSSAVAAVLPTLLADDRQKHPLPLRAATGGIFCKRGNPRQCIQVLKQRTGNSLSTAFVRDRSTGRKCPSKARQHRLCLQLSTFCRAVKQLYYNKTILFILSQTHAIYSEYHSISSKSAKRFCVGYCVRTNSYSGSNDSF